MLARAMCDPRVARDEDPTTGRRAPPASLPARSHPWRSLVARYAAASLLVACHAHPHRADGGATQANVPTSSEVELVEPARAPPPGARVVGFPLRPDGCDYDVHAVSPGQANVSPHDEQAGREPGVRNLHLTFVGDPSTSVVVQWSTDNETLASEVRFAATGHGPDAVAHGYSFTYGGGGSRREHEVHLCGLTPSTTYAYDAGGPAARSPRFQFTTAPDGPREVRLLVAGDARTDPVTWGAIATHALAERPDAMLFSGDAVVDGASQARWDDFFARSTDLLGTTPSLWADGNHEGISEVYFALFAFPDNGDPHRREHWYAVTYGPVRVIVLNDTTVPRSEIAGIERDWLERTLAAVDRARTPWVVTMHHQPMYTDSIGHLPDAVTRAAWLPLFERFHVDVDISGHVHNYESTEPIRAGAVTDDAHGTRFIIFGGGGAPLYHFLPRQPWSHGREVTHGYGMLQASATHLRWDAHRVDGSLIETIDVAR
jgi:hypothetical protein